MARHAALASVYHNIFTVSISRGNLHYRNKKPARGQPGGQTEGSASVIERGQGGRDSIILDIPIRFSSD